jgi:MFS family permease
MQDDLGTEQAADTVDSKDEAPKGRFHVPLVALLVFTGGFSVMAIELLGGRIMAPFFGSSIHVWGSIITVFMAALSLGYLLGGWFSLRSPSLTRLALIFMVSGLTVLPLLALGDPLMEWVFLNFEDPRYGSLLAAVLLFFVPTVALGMVSPYAIRLLVRVTQHSGQVAGTLYFLSTLGSAIGTLMTAFYLVLWFEVSTIVLAVAGALIGSAILAAIGDRMGVDK